MRRFFITFWITVLVGYIVLGTIMLFLDWLLR